MIFLIIGALILSFSAVFMALSDITPVAFAAYRMLSGGIVLMFIGLLQKSHMRYQWNIIGLLLLCAIFFTIDLITWHKSILYIGPGLATVLNNFHVFFIALISIFIFKEKMSPRTLFGLITVIIGFSLLISARWSTAGSLYQWGVNLAIISAFSYALILLFLQRIQFIDKQASPLIIMGLLSLFSGFMLILTLLFMPQESLTIPDLNNLLLVLLYGLAIQALGWYLVSRGLACVNITIAALVLLLQPSLAFLWDVLFFGRATTLIELLATIVILFSIYLTLTRKKK